MPAIVSLSLSHALITAYADNGIVATFLVAGGVFPTIANILRKFLTSSCIVLCD